MEFKFFGANCIKISTKKANIVIDDTLASNGKKPVTTNKDISINTYRDLAYTNSDLFVINSAGEYELSEISVKGVPAKLHFDPQKTSIMYSIHTSNISIAVTGHIDPNLTDEQLEAFGVVDVLILPVGGGGYTLDSIEAVKLIKSIEPKIIIPTHYESKNIKYEVPQLSLEEFLKSYGSVDAEIVDSYKMKDNNLPEKSRVVVLKEQ